MFSVANLEAIIFFATIVEIEMLYNHGQLLLLDTFCQDHSGLIVIVEPHPSTCKVP